MTMNGNVIDLPQTDKIRQARGAFVKHLMDDDSRSARYMAARIGISNSAFGDRLKGRAPFLADELEAIAHLLKIDPIDFYSQYIAVGPGGIEPPTSTVKSRRSCEVIPFPKMPLRNAG